MSESRTQVEDSVFLVVGQHKVDPDHLLLLGTDGRHYDYNLLTSDTSPIESGEDWLLDTRPYSERASG